MIKITKRDGREENFDREKIASAIKKAFIEVDGFVDEYAEKVSYTISSTIEELSVSLSVEEIQDLVEKMLMKTKREDIA